MRKKGYIVTGAMILIFSVAYILHEKNKLSISDIKWDFEKESLNVTFLVRNNTREEVINKLSIRAFKDKRISNAIVSDILGEKTITVNLFPGEEKALSENISLKLNIMPDVVAVTAINNK